MNNCYHYLILNWELRLRRSIVGYYFNIQNVFSSIRIVLYYMKLMIYSIASLSSDIPVKTTIEDISGEIVFFLENIFVKEVSLINLKDSSRSSH